MSETGDREAHYARLADAVEAGEYDVIDSPAEVRPDYRHGRPRRGDAVEETRPLAVRLTESDRRRLADYADRTGQPMSAVIRAAIDEYLGKHPAA
ncbi:ribbon-helix-helix protein, CopG family [Dietzia sp. DQ11-44]|nr:ribbon-helix-helix protein, CopG family [Dietzia sp. Cai40]MBB1043047.1 ribbon-helix-helix protein, CopG family [Dietzia sp. DQ11-44]MBB1058307.1 ribbon-helix-helix protein, CopG family [Dietzia sp. B19]MBC7274162.1 ribbon-helix-helix protein, CopG family [Streptomyces sp.]